MRITPITGRFLGLFVGLAACALAGCGPSYGSLSGKVTFNGGLLKGGYVTLVPDGGGDSFTAEIQEDGTYQMPRVKSGKYKVCVDTSNLAPAKYYGPPGVAAKKINNVPPKGADVPEFYKMSNPQTAVQAQNAKRYVPIPNTYASPETTPLSIEIKSSGQTYDVPVS